MPRFFVSPESIMPIREGQYTVRLEGEDALHLSKSLRKKSGDAVTVSDGVQFDYRGKVDTVTKQFVDVTLLEREENKTEPKVKIILYQALPKGDKLSFIVEKSVELGVHAIQPVLTSRSVSRPDATSMERKTERLQRTAQEAAKQSDRGIIPQVFPLLSYEEALAKIAQKGKDHQGILFYEQETVLLSSLVDTLPLSGLSTLSLLIGSEGGFSEEEVSLAKKHGLLIASLGPRILRTETAPLAALAALFFALGEF